MEPTVPLEEVVAVCEKLQTRAREAADTARMTGVEAYVKKADAFTTAAEEVLELILKHREHK